MFLKQQIEEINKDQYEITDEFVNAIRLMEDKSSHVFITGRAGTGKSTVLTLFRRLTERNIVVLAPTGIAAINVRGSTIHSFFMFPPRIITEDNINIKHERKKLFKAIDVIVIDEVSMVRADYLDGIDKSLRWHRNRDIPFGGVKMIFVGDMHQLPPVVKNEEKIYFTDYYETEYFFSAPAISEIDLRAVELTNIFRQKDQDFINLLNNIRDNECNQEELNYLNNLVEPVEVTRLEDSGVWLCSTKSKANNINTKKLEMLQSKEFTYPARITGRFDNLEYPTENLLRLKVGSQIMMVKNDSDRRWVNGTIGTVEFLSDKKIKVKINDKIYLVEIETWESIDYKYDQKTKRIKEKVIGSFDQYPLKLAWAMTIHKSQSKTFDKIIVDIGKGAFAHGQVYVALSRSTSLEGIRLNSYVRERDIICDPRIIEFERRYLKSKKNNKDK